MGPRWDPFFVFSMVIIAIALVSIGPEGKLDGRFVYSVMEAQEYFQSLSADERILYFWGEFLDYLFMINYTVVLSALAGRAFHSLSNMKYLAFLPASVDFLETISIQLILGGILPENFLLLPYFTGLKWLVVFFVVGTIGGEYLKKRFFTQS